MGAPTDWKVGEFSDCRIMLKHFAQPNQFGIGYINNFVCEKLPAAIVRIVDHVEHWHLTAKNPPQCYDG